MSTLEHRLCAEVNVSVDGHQEMAGFQVSINGRFWVSTEADSVSRGMGLVYRWLVEGAGCRRRDWTRDRRLVTSGAESATP